MRTAAAVALFTMELVASTALKLGSARVPRSLSVRTALDAAIEAVAKDSIQTVLEMIQKHHQQVAREAQTAPPFVRNRHEAYGIAAEQLVKINAAVKAIKSDTDRLLGTLADPNFNAVDATSSASMAASSAVRVSSSICSYSSRMGQAPFGFFTAALPKTSYTKKGDAELAESGLDYDDYLSACHAVHPFLCICSMLKRNITSNQSPW